MLHLARNIISSFNLMRMKECNKGGSKNRKSITAAGFRVNAESFRPLK